MGQEIQKDVLQPFPKKRGHDISGRERRARDIGLGGKER